MTIQWFPGHMAKTRRLIADNLGLVDVALELLDARLPQSSRNPLLNELLGAKPRVLVLAKADLAEEDRTKDWLAYFRRQGLGALACDLKGGNPKGEIKAISEALRRQAEDILSRRSRRGITNKVIRAMVTGIPNAGKSTLINLCAGGGRTATADRPGVTKGKQWIRLGADLEMLDMPGILWPDLRDREGARKLAVTGAIGDNAYDTEELALWLIRWLRQNRPGRLASRYGVAEDDAGLVVDDAGQSDREAAGEKGGAGQRERDDAEPAADGAGLAGERDDAEPATDDAGLAENILALIGRRRGFLRKGGLVETGKTAVMLLDELRGGKLGRVTWDDPAAAGGGP
ncbi:MAG: ribosome biogenesis GTPase YlqF [Peptococcaceae bacterium]|jgi:ribosome biogenesis GTPase A|nr:ribosome biogenesis GTPase YlqF [Peptococcaceae bacterium]